MKPRTIRIRIGRTFKDSHFVEAEVLHVERGLAVTKCQVGFAVTHIRSGVRFSRPLGLESQAMAALKSVVRMLPWSKLTYSQISRLPKAKQRAVSRAFSEAVST